MKQPTGHIFRHLTTGWMPPLCGLGLSFIIGGLLGHWVADQLYVADASYLTDYLSHYMALLQQGALIAPPPLSVIWSQLQWLLFTLVMGFSALGLLGVPVLFCIRGFFLSFSITGFTAALGQRGLVLAALSLGVSGILTLPALFVVGVQGVQASQNLARRFWGKGREALPYSKAYFTRCGLCGGVLMLAILLDYFVTPRLLCWVAQFFL